VDSLGQGEQLDEEEEGEDVGTVEQGVVGIDYWVVVENVERDVVGIAQTDF